MVLAPPHLVLPDRKLIDQFLNGYYRPAGKPIGAYTNLIHDEMQALGQPLGCYEEPDWKFITFQTLAKGWKHLQTDCGTGGRQFSGTAQARAAHPDAGHDSLGGFAKTGVEAARVLADFKSRAQSIGIKRVSEQETFDKLEAKLKS